MNYIFRHKAERERASAGLNVRAGFNQVLIKTKQFVISRRGGESTLTKNRSEIYNSNDLVSLRLDLNHTGGKGYDEDNKAGRERNDGRRPDRKAERGKRRGREQLGLDFVFLHAREALVIMTLVQEVEALVFGVMGGSVTKMLLFLFQATQPMDFLILFLLKQEESNTEGSIKY